MNNSSNDQADRPDSKPVSGNKRAINQTSGAINETAQSGSVQRLVRLRKSEPDTEIKSIHRRIQLKRNVEKLINAIFHICTLGLFRHLYNLELPLLRIEDDYNLIQTQTSMMGRQLATDN